MYLGVVDVKVRDKANGRSGKLEVKEDVYLLVLGSGINTSDTSML